MPLIEDDFGSYRTAPTDNHVPTPGHERASQALNTQYQRHNAGALDFVNNDARSVRGMIDYYSQRMFLDANDRPCILVRNGQWTVERGERVPIRRSMRVMDYMNRTQDIGPGGLYLTANATSLRKEDWIQLDREVLKVARPVLKAWADLAAANSYGGFNGMRKMTLEYEAMSDPGEALVDMDAMSEGRTDSPRFKLRSLPLPITHGDFWFSERRLEVSRNSTPLDTTMAEAVSRRIAEKVEQTTIGLITGMAYGLQSSGITAHDTSAPDDGHGSALGGSNVYGYANYPHRLTKTNFTAPTASDWVPDTTNNDILAAVQQLLNQNFTGPYVLYHSRDWTQYMSRVYAVSGGNNNGETLRSMILKNPDITDVRRLDFLTSTFTFLIVQMTSDVARAINGMDITTLNWPSIGGMRQNFKIMCINVPQIRSDFKGQCGILHGTTA